MRRSRSRARLAGLTSTVLIALISLTLPVSMMVAIASSVAFDSEMVSSRLAKNIVDSEAVRQLIAVQILQDQTGQAEQSPFSFQRALAHLEPEDRQAITRILFPDGWMLAQLEQNIDQAYRWLEGEQDRPDLWIDLRPVRQRLGAGGSLQIAEIVVSSWPICTEQQLIEIGSSAIILLDGSRPICQPPSPLRSALVEYLLEGVQSEALLMPERMPIEDLGSQDNPGSGAELKRSLNRIRTLAGTMWLVPASLLGLILAVRVRSLRDLLRWWGLPLFGSGLVGVLMTVLIGSAVPEWMSSLSQTWQGNPLQPPLLTTLRELLESALGASLVVMVLLAGAGGFALFLGWWLTGRAAPPNSGSISNLEGPSGMFG